MARFTPLHVPILATSLFTLGVVTSGVAAESNRYGIPDFPEAQATEPKARVAPVVAPRIAPVVAPVTSRPQVATATVEPTAKTPPSKENPDQKPVGVSGFFQRMFTFKRGTAKKSEAEAPPVSRADQPPVQTSAQPKPKPKTPSQSQPQPAPQIVAVKPVAPGAQPAPVQAPMASSDSPLAESAPGAGDEATDAAGDPSLAEPTPLQAQASAPTPASGPALAPASKPSTLKSWSSRLRWSNFIPVQNGTVPALVAGALPLMRYEARRGRAPNLSRQSRLDVDQRIERLGPELEPVVNSDPIRGVSYAGSAPALAGAEDPVISLETLAALQAKQESDVGSAKSDQIVVRTEEIKLIPYETKRGEQFRLVSLFFDPPPPKMSKATTPTSSATYEQK